MNKFDDLTLKEEEQPQFRKGISCSLADGCFHGGIAGSFPTSTMTDGGLIGGWLRETPNALACCQIELRDFFARSPFGTPFASSLDAIAAAVELCNVFATISVVAFNHNSWHVVNPLNLGGCKKQKQAKLVSSVMFNAKRCFANLCKGLQVHL